jgi:hypothetical protein
MKADFASSADSAIEGQKTSASSRPPLSLAGAGYILEQDREIAQNSAAR